MKKVLLILIAFIAPLTAIFAQIDLHYERYTNQDDPVAHRDYTSCSNGFGGITAVLPEFDTASPDLNMRFVVFDSNMNIKRKYLYKDTNGRKLVPMDIKYSNDGLQYYICGYVIDQSQNLNPWLLILDTSGTVSQSKYLGNNGIFTRILEFNDTTLVCAGALGNSVAFNTNRSCFISIYNKSAVLRYQYALSNAASNTYFDVINDIDEIENDLIIAGTYTNNCTLTGTIEPKILFCSMNPFTGTVTWSKTINASNRFTTPNILIHNNIIIIAIQTRINGTPQAFNFTGFNYGGIQQFCKILTNNATMNCSNNVDLNWHFIQDLQSAPNDRILVNGKYLRNNSNIPWSFEFDIIDTITYNSHIYKTDFLMANSDPFSYSGDSVSLCGYIDGLYPLFSIHNVSMLSNNNFLLSTLDKKSLIGVPAKDENYKSWFITLNNNQSITYQTINLIFANIACPTWSSNSITFNSLMLNSNTAFDILKEAYPFSINNDIDLHLCPIND